MTKFEDIAAAIGMSYSFEDWSRQNFLADTADLPIVLDILPASGNINITGGQVRISYDRTFAFMDECEFDYESSDANNIVTAMTEKAVQFIAHINGCGLWEPIDGDMAVRAAYDLLDRNMAGVIVEFRLTPLAGKCEDDYR